MVPLRSSNGGVAKCVGDVRKVHAFTHQNRVINKHSKFSITLYEKAMHSGHECKQRCSLVLSSN